MPKSMVSGLDYEILYRGSFAMLQVSLDREQSVKAEAGAMVGMSDTLTLEGKLEGGLLGGLGRMLAGEKFFFQTLAARRGEGVAFLSPSSLGDIGVIEMDGNTPYTVAKDGFLAASSGIEINATMQNLTHGLFSGEGFFVLKITGRGTLFVSSYGAIDEVDIPAGETFTLDNYHLVAWPSSMHYSIEKAASGWISSFTSGEGLVCKFQGPGKVFFQSRNPKGFADWIKSMIPSR